MTSAPLLSPSLSPLLAPLPPGAVLLDLGCGTSSLLSDLLPPTPLRLILVDSSPAALSHPRRGSPRTLRIDLSLPHPPLPSLLSPPLPPASVAVDKSTLDFLLADVPPAGVAAYLSNVSRSLAPGGALHVTSFHGPGLLRPILEPVFGDVVAVVVPRDDAAPPPSPDPPPSPPSAPSFWSSGSPSPSPSYRSSVHAYVCRLPLPPPPTLASLIAVALDSHYRRAAPLLTPGRRAELRALLPPPGLPPAAAYPLLFDASVREVYALEDFLEDAGEMWGAGKARIDGEEAAKFLEEMQ
ncbi:hypothetical protein TeGR_g10443 [Tetraparma gracilis]|uniref:S-adenosyl-L-methionine-dependent methyltransferase n=1 Tax=Tetraparma gracilis TaxID=2962635 RepID=A0ABQ6MNZ7_9STRA|nr:hypothetical protein TeGR_g10443 [Tetraparma gracilis]